MMKIEPNTVHVWSICLNQFDPAMIYASLSPHEHARMKRYRFTKNRMQYAGTRYALRKILSCYLEGAPHEHEFILNPFGKPNLLNQALNFNLSHSEERAVIAITQHQEIGIDIERVQMHFNPALAKRFFSHSEYAALMSLAKENQAAGFFRIWTKKEALIKAIGRGLAISLSSFAVSEQAKTDHLDFDHAEWIVQSLDQQDAYQIAIASNDTVTSISYHAFADYP